MKLPKNYQNLLSVKYRFVFSLNRKTKEIFLDFKHTDFRHMAGLHYLDDINISRDPNKTLQSIFNKDITDEVLCKSRKYREESLYCGTIENRIIDIRHLEDFLDVSDFLRIYKMQPFGSQINADYFIESSIRAYKRTVYIFIKKREEDESYVINSFFAKQLTFSGTSTYWMLKQKIQNNDIKELYRHKNFQNK